MRDLFPLDDTAAGGFPLAVISPCESYRYFLSRSWGEGKTISFIGLNPSIADAYRDDPTIRRCVQFAKNMGGGRLFMVNIFAYRSTDPKGLHACSDPVGPENDDWLEYAVRHSDIVVAAWGNHGLIAGRGQVVAERYSGLLFALRVTSQGQPGHPLYVPYSAELKRF